MASTPNLTQQWLSKFFDAHIIYKPASDDTQDPSMSMPARFALFQHIHWGWSQRYPTSSHCWVELNFVKLTTSSVHSIQPKILWDISTKTFQDPVIITHRIKIYMEWLVIQDSSVDEDCESALRSVGYGDSTVTSAA